MPPSAQAPTGAAGSGAAAATPAAAPAQALGAKGGNGPNLWVAPKGGKGGKPAVNAKAEAESIEALMSQAGEVKRRRAEVLASDKPDVGMEEPIDDV